MNTKVKTLFFFVGLILFVSLLNQFGIENLFYNIRKTGWWIIPIIGVWGLVYLLNAWAWTLVIKSFKYKVSFKDVFSISLSGFAINYITPFINLGGEPYKIFALKDQIGLNNSVSTVILYSMLHFLSSFVFWFLAIILIVFSFPLTTELLSILLILFLFTIIGLWFFYSKHKNGIFNPLLSLIKKIPFISRLSEKLNLKEKSLIVIDNNIKELYQKQKPTFFLSLSLEVIARIIASLEFIFILRAIGINILIEEAIFINAFSSLVLNLFFFIPMGLGIREGGLFIIMGGLSLAPAVGIYIGLVNRVREFFWILIGLVLIQISKQKNYKNEFSYLEIE